MVVSAPMIEEVHADGDDGGLVPAHPLFPHPDGVVPPLEIQVGVLLPAPVNMLRLISNYLNPKPSMFLLKSINLNHSNVLVLHLLYS